MTKAELEKKYKEQREELEKVRAELETLKIEKLEKVMAELEALKMKDNIKRDYVVMLYESIRKTSDLMDAKLKKTLELWDL